MNVVISFLVFWVMEDGPTDDLMFMSKFDKAEFSLIPFSSSPTFSPLQAWQEVENFLYGVCSNDGAGSPFSGTGVDAADAAAGFRAPASPDSAASNSSSTSSPSGCGLGAGGVGSVLFPVESPSNPDAAAAAAAADAPLLSSLSRPNEKEQQHRHHQLPHQPNSTETESIINEILDLDLILAEESMQKQIEQQQQQQQQQ